MGFFLFPLSLSLPKNKLFFFAMDPLQVFPCVTVLCHCLHEQVTSLQVICTASITFKVSVLGFFLFPFLPVNKNTK